MQEALEAFQTGGISGDTPQSHLTELYGYALAHNKVALQMALQQRYPQLSGGN